MNSYSGVVLEQLGRLFNRGTVAGLSEGALLERYVAERDEAAFAALVARHGPMVLGVCRRILRDERDIEDAFQATFLVLVRRAGTIRDSELIGRWLYGVAHRVAVRAKAHAARRHAHEQSVAEPIEAGTDPSSDQPERRELAAILDEEINRLPSRLRAAVVLCYLEGMSHDEAARCLRWPVGTLRSRMARARDLLRCRLARRGVTADGAFLVASLARPQVSAEWIGATVRSSLGFVANKVEATALASAQAVALARRIIQAMLIAKVKYIGTVGLGIVLALGGVGTLAYSGRAGSQTPSPSSGTVTQPDDQADAPKKPSASGRRTDARPAGLPEQLQSIQTKLDVSATVIANLQAELRELQEQLHSVTVDLEARGAAESPAHSNPGKGASSPGSGPANPPVSGRTRAAFTDANASREVRPAAALPSPAAGPNSVKNAGNPDGSDRPHYIQLGQRVVVVAPDGGKVATYHTQIGKSRVLRLPAIRGVRREVIATAPNPYQAPNRSQSAPQRSISSATSAWFVALDLDRDRKVTRIAAFNVVDETWIEREIPEPVARTSVSFTKATVFTIGRTIYAFSAQAKRWGVLEFRSGVNARPILREDSTWAEDDGNLYIFNEWTGTWDDIFARTILDEPGDQAKGAREPRQ